MAVSLNITQDVVRAGVIVICTEGEGGFQGVVSGSLQQQYPGQMVQRMSGNERKDANAGVASER